MTSVETFVRRLVSRYVTHPKDMRITRHKNRIYLSLSYLDHRLVIGKGGRNIHALSVLTWMATRPSRFEISVPEGSCPADRLPQRPTVENEDPFSEENALDISQVLQDTLLDCGIVSTNLSHSFPEPGTTAISVEVNQPIDLEEKRAFSIIFGAMGKIHGRNIRIYIDDSHAS